jgi:universal stress protein A
MFPYKNVLVAIDYSELTDNIFKKLETIRKDSETNIILLHVVERDMPTLMGASQNQAISYSREWSLEEIKLKANAQNTLKKEAEKYNLGKVNYLNVTYLAEVGVPRFSILFAAKAHKADLIIVGAHGVSGIRKLIGSTAQSVLNNATCDVLAVRND